MADKIETDQNKKSIKMAEKTFARELNYIEDVKIRTYAVEMLRLAPGYFYYFAQNTTPEQRLRRG